MDHSRQRVEIIRALVLGRRQCHSSAIIVGALDRSQVIEDFAGQTRCPLQRVIDA